MASNDRGSVSKRPINGLVCLCHLRWSFVWQRPQHLMTRLARHTDVIVVEEPELAANREPASLRRRSSDGITILTPMLPGHDGTHGFTPTSNVMIAALLDSYLSSAGWTAPGRRNAAWYYTPMALGALPADVPIALTVYDAMDELANFRGAPGELRVLEQTLIGQSDLVFTGGPSLYASRRDRHPAVHCFPSGVETSHFAAARSVDRSPEDVASLPRPVLGFYGVIDERLDVELLAAVADLRPDWSILLIGPVVKIDPATLPVRDNIVHLGMRGYAELPAYLSTFDVAILPFAINEATRFISPTKTLEYLAAGRPVVSTPIADVVDLYGEVVAIADGPVAFAGAVEALLDESALARASREERADDVVRHHEWDSIVDRMWSAMVADPLGPVPETKARRALVAALAD